MMTTRMEMQIEVSSLSNGFSRAQATRRMSTPSTKCWSFNVSFTLKSIPKPLRGSTCSLLNFSDTTHAELLWHFWIFILRRSELKRWGCGWAGILKVKDEWIGTPGIQKHAVDLKLVGSRSAWGSRGSAIRSLIIFCFSIEWRSHLRRSSWYWNQQECHSYDAECHI